MRNRYLIHQRKYNLPSFNRLQKELEIEATEDTNFVLKHVRRRIQDKLSYAARIIESLIYPSVSSLPNMYESKFFTEKEKLEMDLIHRKILALERASNRLDLSSTDKEDAEFINKLTKEWSFIKPKITKILKKAESSWLNEKTKIEKFKYFG